LHFKLETAQNPMLRPASASDASAVAELLLASRRAFLPYAPIAHSDADVYRWVREQLIPGGAVVIWEQDSRITGVLATSRDETASWVDQLYVLPGFEGRGVGSALLRHAHERLTCPIRLYTFHENNRARSFYERHGYKAVAFSDGQSNEERCPDVLYEYTHGSTGA
jgi:ribosomal protein S18 acetylase RimI-like enzyme